MTTQMHEVAHRTVRIHSLNAGNFTAALKGHLKQDHEQSDMALTYRSLESLIGLHSAKHAELPSDDEMPWYAG